MFIFYFWCVSNWKVWFTSRPFEIENGHSSKGPTSKILKESTHHPWRNNFGSPEVSFQKIIMTVNKLQRVLDGAAFSSWSRTGKGIIRRNFKNFLILLSYLRQNSRDKLHHFVGNCKSNSKNYLSCLSCLYLPLSFSTCLCLPLPASSFLYLPLPFSTYRQSDKQTNRHTWLCPSRAASSQLKRVRGRSDDG